MSKDPDSESSAMGCILSGAWTLISLPIWLSAVLLLAVSTTTAAKLFALALIFLLPIPLNLLHWEKTSRKIATALLLLAGVTALFLCARQAPGYQDDPAASARVIYEKGTSHSRYSPANLVPELDQQILGSYLFGILDPNLSWDQAGELRKDFKRVYGETARDADLSPLPSVLGFGYREMIGLKPKPGNLFVYVPKGDQPKPAIVFLHGSLGNFKGYWKQWKTFADEQGIAIVAPTFGAGNWEKDGGLQAVDHAREFCEKHPLIDGKKLFLTGLSNGGIGVTHAGGAKPTAWQGLIFISPVLRKSAVETEAFANGWGGRKALVITGEMDKRTTASYVRTSVESMVEYNMKVDAHYLADQDHFLIFSDWPQVRKLIAAWMKEF